MRCPGTTGLLSRLECIQLGKFRSLRHSSCTCRFVPIYVRMWGGIWDSTPHRSTLLRRSASYNILLQPHHANLHLQQLPLACLTPHTAPLCALRNKVPKCVLRTLATPAGAPGLRDGCNDMVPCDAKETRHHIRGTNAMLHHQQHHTPHRTTPLQSNCILPEPRTNHSLNTTPHHTAAHVGHVSASHFPRHTAMCQTPSQHVLRRGWHRSRAPSWACSTWATSLPSGCAYAL